MVSGQDQTFVTMVALREAEAVGIGPHLSHLMYIYKSKITKYMYMVQCPIHLNRKVAMRRRGSLMVSGQDQTFVKLN
jgi:hypothetical protein